MATEVAAGEALEVRPISEFEGLWDVWPRGRRLEAIRAAAREFRQRFKASGQVLGVRSFDIAAAPYPARFALGGAAIGPNPVVSIINRMLVVQYEDFEGRQRTLVWEPTVREGSVRAPFYAQLERAFGDFLAHRVFAHYYHEPDEILPLCGLTNADVDVASFDHLHVQDMRMILGTTTPVGEAREPYEPLFPNARFVVHCKELATFEAPHPMQWAWYVADGMTSARTDRLVVIDGDVELGHGVAIVWTPGHTDGNHSLVLNTPDGIWVSSENGVALDNWQPELSKIPGVRRFAQFFGREIVPNANTLEDSIDQYDSMVKEKVLADPCRRNPRWLQILPSSELAPWKRQWPVVPTFVHGGLEYGALRAAPAAG
jgi:hypothetical protein